MPKTLCVVSNSFEPIVSRETFQEAPGKLCTAELSFKTESACWEYAPGLGAEKGSSTIKYSTAKLFSPQPSGPALRWTSYAYRLVG